MIIHLSENKDDLPTIVIPIDGGLSRGDILYQIVQNLTGLNDYGDHIILEGLNLENGIYYLSLSNIVIN